MYYKRLLESSVFHHSADYCKWEQNLDKACAVWAGHLLVFFFFMLKLKEKFVILITILLFLDVLKLELQYVKNTNKLVLQEVRIVVQSKNLSDFSRYQLVDLHRLACIA